jgi:hypothetical protein
MEETLIGGEWWELVSGVRCCEENACDDMMTKAARDHLNLPISSRLSLVHILAGMRI